MKTRRRVARTVCFAGLLTINPRRINGYDVFRLNSGEWSIRRGFELWPCGTFRSFEVAARMAEISPNGLKIMKVKKKPTSKAVYRLPTEISFTYGPGRPISNVEFCPDCREQFFVFRDSWADRWHICHFPTNSLLVYAAPSKAYALKVFANVLPLLDLHKTARVLWYGDRRPISELVEDYLSNVWKVEYSLDKIPTVQQWRKSNFGNSANDVNSFRTKGKLKVKRRS